MTKLSTNSGLKKDKKDTLTQNKYNNAIKYMQKIQYARVKQKNATS